MYELLIVIIRMFNIAFRPVATNFILVRPFLEHRRCECERRLREATLGGSGGMPPGKVLKKWCNLVASGAFSGWFLLG